MATGLGQLVEPARAVAQTCSRLPPCGSRKYCREEQGGREGNLRPSFRFSSGVLEVHPAPHPSTNPVKSVPNAPTPLRLHRYCTAFRLFRDGAKSLRASEACFCYSLGVEFPVPTLQWSLFSSFEGHLLEEVTPDLLPKVAP